MIKLKMDLLAKSNLKIFVSVIILIVLFSAFYVFTGFSYSGNKANLISYKKCFPKFTGGDTILWMIVWDTFNVNNVITKCSKPSYISVGRDNDILVSQVFIFDSLFTIFNVSTEPFLYFLDLFCTIEAIWIVFIITVKFMLINLVMFCS